MSNEPVEIFVELMRKGPESMLVSNGDVMVWIPYSQIQSESELTEDSEKGDSGDLTVPMWLAEDRRLV